MEGFNTTEVFGDMECAGNQVTSTPAYMPSGPGELGSTPGTRVANSNQLTPQNDNVYKIIFPENNSLNVEGKTLTELFGVCGKVTMQQPVFSSNINFGSNSDGSYGLRPLMDLIPWKRAAQNQFLG